MSFKLEGYKQTTSGATTFSKDVPFNGKTYTYTTNISTGELILTDKKTGNIITTFNPDSNKYETPITDEGKKLFAEITGSTGGQSFLSDTAKTVINDTKKISNAIIEDTNGERASSNIEEENFNKRTVDQVNQKRSYSSTVVDVSESLNSIINDNDLEINNIKSRGFGPLYYPSTLDKNTQNQDIIKFTVGTYKPKKLTLDGTPQLGILSGDSSFNNDSSAFNGTPTEIYLPIQPSITDSNTVDWNENRLNSLQVGLLQSGVTIMNEGGSGITKTIKAFEETFKNNEPLLNAGKLLLAQEAVGAQNVLSRFGGGIVNPNLELLFNGPQLRPFNFNFRLSPRDRSEAQEVRTIIRAFKQSMAVKKTTTGLFLAAPNVFKIEYLHKGANGNPHPSLNRIKTCALKSCVVDYTPENSYATYNDENNTMVSYNMSLQFQELESVTDADYNDTKSLDEIGY